MIELNASHGGQVLRTALGLSALLQKPVRLSNIRGDRPNPGLRAQHLTGVNLLQKICNAEVKGNQLTSTEVEFTPKQPHSEQLAVNIGTAGSITLLLQSLLPVALTTELKLRVLGGTDVKWSPPANYFSHLLFPLLSSHGARLDLKLIKRGYFPKGKGIVSFSSKPARLPLKPFNLTKQGKLNYINVFSHCSSLPKEVCVNQVIAAKNALKKLNAELIEETAFMPSSETIGSGIDLLAVFDGSFIGANALGEKGVSAFKVGEEAGKNLLKELEKKVPVDVHLADQLIPFMALAKGTSKILCSELSSHTKTNIEVVEKFTETKFSVSEQENKTFLVEVKGIGFSKESKKESS